MFFFGTLAVMGSLEFLWPRRKLKIERIDRWPNNFALVLLNGIIMKLIFPMSAVGVASLAMERGYGLFNILNLSGVIVVVLSVILLRSRAKLPWTVVSLRISSTSSSVHKGK